MIAVPSALRAPGVHRTMGPMRWIRPSVALALGLAGCTTEHTDHRCHGTVIPPFEVVVIDEASGSRICDAEVVAFEDDFADFLIPLALSDGQCGYRFYEYRAGSYTVTASRDGFVPASVGPVGVVLQGDCGLPSGTTHVVATLTPE
jgi:hypothetical protein